MSSTRSAVRQTFLVGARLHPVDYGFNRRVYAPAYLMFCHRGVIARRLEAFDQVAGLVARQPVAGLEPEGQQVIVEFHVSGFSGSG